MDDKQDIIIRETTIADSHGIAIVHVDAWRTTYTGIIPDSVLKSLSYEKDEKKQRHHMEHPYLGSKTFVAELVPDGIVGFASGGYEQRGHPIYKGELFVIYILVRHQRRGIGKMLVGRVVDHILQLGLRNMIVWVLEENPAKVFYEKLGGVPVDEKMIKMGRKQLKEIAYGWDDIELIDKLPG